MNIDQAIVGLQKLGCCPLGGALGGKPKWPCSYSQIASLAISKKVARDITRAWDEGKHIAALRQASDVGLWPQIEGYLETELWACLIPPQLQLT